MTHRAITALARTLQPRVSLGKSRLACERSGTKRLKDEWLIVVSSLPPRTALAACRKRWAIECLFGDAKTPGLNLGDTRLTDPRKLGLPIALVALALAWAGPAASDLLGKREPPRKAHGYLAKSWFRTGFDHIRNRLGTDPETALDPWHAIAKPSATQGVV